MTPLDEITRLIQTAHRLARAQHAKDVGLGMEPYWVLAPPDQARAEGV